MKTTINFIVCIGMLSILNNEKLFSQASSATHFGNNTALHWCGWDNTSTIPLQLRTEIPQNIEFFTNNTQRMTILGNGNPGYVGINTTAPASRLDVLDVATQLTLTYATYGTVKTDFFTNSSGYQIISPSGSRLGINTNVSPNANLKVKGSIAALEQLRLTNYFNNNTYARFTTNSLGYLLIDATGNRVGIETTGSPANTLEINSAVANTSGLRF